MIKSGINGPLINEEQNNVEKLNDIYETYYELSVHAGSINFETILGNAIGVSAGIEVINDLYSFLPSGFIAMSHTAKEEIVKAPAIPWSFEGIPLLIGGSQDI